MPEPVSEVFSILPPWSTLVVGIILLLGGGHWLVEGAVRIARRLGISTLLIGLTVVAFGTSSPELAFNLTAALNGLGELAFGNVIGSNIANIGLVLGVVAVVSRLTVHSRVLEKELPLLIAVTALMLVLAWLPATRLTEIPTVGRGHGFSRIDGMVFLAGLAGFGWLWYRVARRDRADPLTREAEREARAEPAGSMPVAIVLFVVGLAALIAGGELTKTGAVGLAQSLGLTQGLIGLTVVAIATSLPELTASLIAVRKGHTDLAIGTVIGSNLFNIVLVLGATSVVAPIPLPADRGWWDLLFMLALTLALLPIALSHQRRIMRWEGMCLITAYVVYMGWSVVREGGA